MNRLSCELAFLYVRTRYEDGARACSVGAGRLISPVAVHPSIDEPIWSSGTESGSGMRRVVMPLRNVVPTKSRTVAVKGRIALFMLWQPVWGQAVRAADARE